MDFEKREVVLKVIDVLEQLGITYLIAGSFASSIYGETQFKVDVFTPRPGGFTDTELARRQRKEFGSGSNRTAFFASPEDTVLSKLEWYRRGNEVSDTQWRDVVTILKVQRGRLDTEYLSQSAVELGVADLLKDAQTEAASLWES